MSTKRTSAVLAEILDDNGEIYEGNCPEKLVKLSRQLEAELKAMTDKVSEMELYKKAYQDNARKYDAACAELSAVNKDLKAEREKVGKLEDIIRRAATKFCEDGPDGEIAAGMFRILGEKALEATK